MTCSATTEPPEGTAAVATTWLCLEQPGPWGAHALTESHLDPGLGAELTARADSTGVRVVLIRRPGTHPDRHRPTPRRAYLAHTTPGRTHLLSTHLTDPKHLLDLDFTAAGLGQPTGFGAPTAEPILLICTNGKRDLCCAVAGRPLATALAATHGDRVWEATHLGGHRFAPTALHLPTGYAYANLDPATATTLLTQPAVHLTGNRGRSTYPAPAQTADLAIRHHTATTDPDALTAATPEPTGPRTWTVPVHHHDGRSWHVTVTATPGHPRPASCGATPTPALHHTATAITPIRNPPPRRPTH